MSAPLGLPDVRTLAPAPAEVEALSTSPKASERSEPERVSTAPDVPVRTLGNTLGLAGQGAAFAEELATFLETPEGGRNAALNALSRKLAQIEGTLPRDLLQGALFRAGELSGLEKREIRATVKSGYDFGRANPRKVKEAVAEVEQYKPLDLEAWFSVDHPSPAHIGPAGLIYEGSLVWLSGEPEAGKTILALQVAVSVMEGGQKVLWLDEEAGPADTLSKLAALGATTEMLTRQFGYLSPLGRNLMETADQLHALALAGNVGLVVLDSSAAILANAGLDEDRNGQVVAFVNRAILPLSKQHGIATIVIDHKTKSNAESRYSRGASAKLGIVDLAFNVIARKPFSKHESGVVELVTTKDRWGDHGRGATWIVDVNTGDGAMGLVFSRVTPEQLAASKPQTKVNTANSIVERVVQIVTDAGAEGLSKARIQAALDGVGSEKARQAIQVAQDRGLVRVGGRQVSGAWSLVAVANELDVSF